MSFSRRPFSFMVVAAWSPKFRILVIDWTIKRPFFETLRSSEPNKLSRSGWILRSLSQAVDEAVIATISSGDGKESSSEIEEAVKEESIVGAADKDKVFFS